jgi:hypothetical protein
MTGDSNICNNPARKHSLYDEEKPVRKIHFAEQDAPSESSFKGHPAPDPLLLVSKSAVVWAKRRGVKLAAAAEPQDDASWDTMHEIAMQHFLKTRDLANKINPVGLTIIF